MGITYYHRIIIHIRIIEFNSNFIILVDRAILINTFGTMDENPLACHISPIFTSIIITDNTYI